jgi:Ricin-type beta-trefoil lectin domain-like
MNSKRLLTALAVAAATLAAPAVASAQPLSSIAIMTGASSGYFALDVEGGSTASGAKVIQWYGNWAGNQRWNVVTRSDGKQQIVNQKSGMCLTTSGVAGARLFQYICNGSRAQEWTGNLPLAGSNRATRLQNPTYGLVADIEGGEWWAGAYLVGWYANGQANQDFWYTQLA